MNIHRKTATETRAKSVRESGQILRCSVRRQDDLFVVLIKVVEDVEKCLLSGFFAYQKLHVVHHEYVARAVFFSELVVFFVGLVANDVDKLGYKCFRADVKHAHVLFILEKIVADCVQKVCFAKTYARVNEERIESRAGIFGNGFASRQSVGVGFAFHKIFKGVFFLKRAFLFALFFGSEVGDKALILDENRLFVQILRLFVGGDDNHVLDLRIVRRHHVFYGVAVSRIDGFLRWRRLSQARLRCLQNIRVRAFQSKPRSLWLGWK